MTCQNCGNQVADHMKFCPKCGTPGTTSRYSPPQYQQPAWQLNAPIGQPKKKSKAGKILLIVGIIIVVLAAGAGVAIYFGVRTYMRNTKSSSAYVLAESILRSSQRVKERLGEIKSIGVPIGTFNEADDGTGFAAFVMSVEGEKASGQYVVGMGRSNSKWQVQTAVVKLQSGEEINVVYDPEDKILIDPPASNPYENQTQNDNANTSNSNKKPKTISGGVLNGKAISLPKPAYPPAARAAKASGTVVVQVTVDEQGKVISANAVSGHRLLRASAVAAARQARLSPTKLSGEPVKVTGVLTYNFVPDP